MMSRGKKVNHWNKQSTRETAGGVARERTKSGQARGGKERRETRGAARGNGGTNGKQGAEEAGEIAMMGTAASSELTDAARVKPQEAEEGGARSMGNTAAGLADERKSSIR